MTGPMNIPDLGKMRPLEPGELDREAFMKQIADKRMIGSSPKEQLTHAVGELMVRLEVVEVMLTKLCRDMGMSGEDVAAYLEMVFTEEIPDTAEGAEKHD